MANLNIKFGMIGFLREQAQPHVRKESDLDRAYQVKSELLGWYVNSMGKATLEGVKPDQILLQPMCRSGDIWVVDSNEKLQAISFKEFFTLLELFDLANTRRGQSFGEGWTR